MNITRIHISNVLGVADAELNLSGSPLALICGDNAVGKSSFREAVSLALRGIADRAPAKKDWQKLVTDGAVSGAVTIEVDGGAPAKLRLPSGTGASPWAALDDVAKYVADLCIGNKSFAREPDKTRRALIGKLYAAQDAHTAIAARLVEAGQPSDLVAAITPLLRTGTDDAITECQRRATEGKGAWKKITNETWGSVKGADWQPAEDPGSKPKRTVAQLQEQRRLVEQKIAGLNQQIGAASRELTEQQVEELRTTAATFAAREAERVRQKGSVDDLVARQQALQAEHDGATSGTSLACPHCQQALTWKGGALVEATPVEKDVIDRLADELQQVGQQLVKARLDYNDAAAGADEADRAARRLDQIAKAPKVDVDQLQQDLEAERFAIEKVDADIEAAAEWQRWQRCRDDAAAEHAGIVKWLALAEALANPDIAVTSGSNPVAEFNAALQAVSSAIGWHDTVLGDAGELYYGGRPIQFGAESDRWKAEATVAMALARAIPEIGMVMLDRCDVLAPQARPALFRYLANESGLGAALAFATLKAPPTMPPSVAVLWLGEAVKVAA